MRSAAILALLIALTGCSFAPPKPPKCQGDFRPLNIQQVDAKEMTIEESIALCEAGDSYV